MWSSQMCAILRKRFLQRTFSAMRFESTTTQKQPKRGKLFDRRMKTKQRDYLASLENAEVFEYIKEEFGYRMADRVLDIKRKFNVLVELGCGRGYVAPNLFNDMVDTYFACDTSVKSLEHTKELPGVNFQRLLVDEEHIPLRNDTVDIVVSSLSLHWINELPETFKSILNILKNDGAFLGSIFGGQTLFELRSSLQLAETEREGGFAPHISPFVQTIDVGALLTRAGFTLQTIDVDEMVVNYPTMFELLTDLQCMAESNAAFKRKLHLNRDTMFSAAAIYKDMYANEDGSIPATFQIYNFIGWKPDPSQPKPAERGSGQFSLKDIHEFEKFMSESLKKEDK
ncbi:NADH dehydrogenase [ubiquinone] 1 alpha subcomplex assembly factor 5-like protein [Leptotrombidium deliense]|uniref:Arginine-hydroxylase NDUFAF5, mitochondrial n=1 Tax=Leptotrombidium deliense TaxID=299467 RepID=A0A443SAT3_9ACAR|nr:NADH dehydrogenase [ubiquinone] 1 alpha subcomplex assembly factor 5-like protein [Leptotrombidium deliense]